MIIRDETTADLQAITEVTIAAFNTLPIGDHTEQFIIHALRSAGALTLSLVAEIDGKVVGHVAFSPVTVSDGTTGWYGLGPVSVMPELHRQGIGKALIQEGLVRLKDLDAHGCVLVGDPVYYERFGFVSHSRLLLEGVPPEFFLVLPLAEKIPEGFVTFHGGFMAQE